MKLKFFTKKAAEQIVKDYKHLIGNDFYFNSNKKKYKLSHIYVRKSIFCQGYFVVFSNNYLVFTSVVNFMSLNKSLLFEPQNYGLVYADF